jgi:SAM-dependent methyltransferase
VVTMGEIFLTVLPTDKVCELGGGSNPMFCRSGGVNRLIGDNVDIRPEPGVDIVANLENPLPIASEVYDLVFSKYSIEHINWRKVKDHVKEIYRILKPGGRVFILTANLYEQCKMVAGSKEWDESFSCMIFGDQNFNDNTHKVGFSPHSITKMFVDTGFKDICVDPLPQCHTDMILQARK